MAVRKINESTLTAIGNAIRSKTGGSALINPEDMADEIDSIETSGGSFEGIEIVEMQNGKITKMKYHGKNVPKNALLYLNYGVSPAVELDLEEVESIEDFAFQHVGVVFKNCQNIKTIGYYGLALRIAPNIVDLSNYTLSLDEYTGLAPSGSTATMTFRSSQGNNFYGNILCPKMSKIPSYMCYSLTDTINVQCGSVGYPVMSCDTRPFYGMTGGGTITIYTKGSLIDTIKPVATEGVGPSTSVVFKAAENTSYGGVDYTAGDTIST